MTRAGIRCRGEALLLGLFEKHRWRRAGAEPHWPTELPPVHLVTPVSHRNPGTPQGAKQLSSLKGRTQVFPTTFSVVSAPRTCSHTTCPGTAHGSATETFSHSREPGIPCSCPELSAHSPMRAALKQPLHQLAASTWCLLALRITPRPYASIWEESLAPAPRGDAPQENNPFPKAATTASLL